MYVCIYVSDWVNYCSHSHPGIDRIDIYMDISKTHFFTQQTYKTLRRAKTQNNVFFKLLDQIA